MAWNDWLKKGKQTVGQSVNAVKDKVEEYAPKIQNTVQNVGNAVSTAVNTGKQVVDKVKKEAPGVIKMVQNGVQEGINNTQDWVQDKVQTVANGVSQAIDYGKELYGAGKAGYEGAVEGVKDYYSGDSETQAPEQDNTNWASEYDKVMNETTAPTQNPDGSVTVTQPNGQPINTSPAASATLGEGAGQWQAELDNIMNQIMNREKFSYDMNGDAMYQQYADMFKNQANLGMQNAMGQAAALTGGYGSSYGQMVGQQAYAQQMQGLNEIGMDLYDRAYDQYLNEGNQLAQQYAMVADRDQQAYNRAVDERNFNYQKYLDELEQSNYEKELDYRAGRDAITDERYNTEWAASEEQRAADNKYRDDMFAYEQGRDAIADERYNQEWAASKEQLALENQRYDTEWKAREEQRGIENKRYDDAFKAQEEANNPNTTYEGEGPLNGQNVPKLLSGVQGLTTTNTNLFDDNGYFKTAAVVTKDADKGTMTYNIGGKEVTLKAGTSPYTNTVNPDAKNGVMDNGYQPDNIDGNKVTESEEEVCINGQWTPIYTTDDGFRWYYDAANNSYEKIPKDEEETNSTTPSTPTTPSTSTTSSTLDPAPEVEDYYTDSGVIDEDYWSDLESWTNRIINGENNNDYIPSSAKPGYTLGSTGIPADATGIEALKSEWEALVKAGLVYPGSPEAEAWLQKYNHYYLNSR